MRSSSAALLLFAAVAPACSQMSGSFSRFFLARGGGNGATSVSKTFVSSSSWTSDADGQIHQETHELRRQTTRDFETGQMMHRKESEVNCKDGDCQKLVHIQAAAPRFHERMMARIMPSMWSGKGKPGLRSMNWAFSHPPVMQQPAVVVHVVPRTVFLAPRSYSEAAPESDEAANSFMLAGGAGLAAAAGVIAIGALMKCHRASADKARERPIRELAQPLAPEQEQNMKCGEPVRPAAAPILAPKCETMYLARVYKRAVDLVEARATRTYLARVYSKAAH